MKPKIFMCYRRSDSAASAGRIYDRLEEKYGEERVFKDVDDIQPGEIFTEVIKNAIEKSTVFLVIIGRYFTQKSGTKKNRLFNEDDYVRLEIEYALKSEKLIIPVFVDGAQMPDKKELPESLHHIINIHGFTFHYDRWGEDFKRFISYLREKLLEVTKKKKPTASKNIFEVVDENNAFFTDARDGLKYKVVRLDGQWWMAENWKYEVAGSYCYDNDITFCTEYGRLYDWKAAIETCPKGWRLPTDEDWFSISQKLHAEDPDSDWQQQAFKNLTTNGNSGFNAILGGYRNSFGGFKFKGEKGTYWTMSEDGEDYPCYCSFSFGKMQIGLKDFDLKYARSCRYVKDE
jgi:uncharacterized protein (TIGR02145 family)